LGNGRIIFAGEATNDTRPGATAHSALETGVRAANEVSRIILAKSF
jgi:monoamine oxidase